MRKDCREQDRDSANKGAFKWSTSDGNDSNFQFLETYKAAGSLWAFCFVPNPVWAPCWVLYFLSEWALAGPTFETWVPGLKKITALQGSIKNPS